GCSRVALLIDDADAIILSSSLWFVTREVGGECNQSCQQYRSDYSVSPKPATKRFLICRIELLILVDDLSAHRTPPSLPSQGRWRGRLSGTSKILCEAVHTSPKAWRRRWSGAGR